MMSSLLIVSNADFWTDFDADFLNRSIAFFRNLRFLRLTFLLYDRLVSRLFIYCKAVKYKVLSPSFIFT